MWMLCLEPIGGQGTQRRQCHLPQTLERGLLGPPVRTASSVHLGALLGSGPKSRLADAPSPVFLFLWVALPLAQGPLPLVT